MTFDTRKGNSFASQFELIKHSYVIYKITMKHKIQLLGSSETVFHLGQLFGPPVRIPTVDKVTEDGVFMSCLLRCAPFLEILSNAVQNNFGLSPREAENHFRLKQMFLILSKKSWKSVNSGCFL